MPGQKRDRMAAAVCSGLAMRACTDAGRLAVASTALTSKRGYWAVTRVRPTDDTSGGALVDTLANSRHIPAREVKIEGSWLNNVVKIWWKTL